MTFEDWLYVLQQLIAVVGILSSCYLDGWRDTMVRRPAEVSWNKYHYVKWASFYPPLVIVTAYLVWKPLWLPLVVGSWYAWQAGKRRGGKSWDSHWLKKLKVAFGWA